MAITGSKDSDVIEEEVKEEKEEKECLLSQAGRKRPSSPPSCTEPAGSPGSFRSSTAAFAFWARFTLLVSLATFFLAALYSLRPKDDKSWFLGLPYDLRSHYSQGRLVKVQLTPDGPQTELFVVERGSRSGENILLLHGLGCSSYSFRDVLRSLGSLGHRAIAIDLPGAGFSDKFVQGKSDMLGGPIGRLWELYSEIKDKGLFWGFHQLVETGQIPYEVEKVRISAKKSNNQNIYGSEGMSRVVGQVIDSLALAPVHLVLHDSTLRVGAELVMANPASVSSVTLVDATSESAAFPSWMIGVPVFREIILRSHFLFAGLLRLCCSRSMDGAAADAYLHLLNGKNGRRAVVETGRALNFSFDVREWAASAAMKNMALMVLWSNTWSDIWIDEGRRVAESVPQARFIHHHGGRWPQEGASDEISEKISEFISSLPKSVRRVEEETPPEHIQKLFEEASSGSGHHHHHHHHSHGHDHHADFMNAYGLDHGWGGANYS